MTTIVEFNPSNLANFTFQPTLDGQTYGAVTTYNSYSNRYYLGIYTQQNVLQLNIPLIASPNVVVQGATTTEASSFIKLITRNGAIYAGMNVNGVGVTTGTKVIGVYGALIELNQNAVLTKSNTTLSFTYSINLMKGYFNTPIVFRASANNFEIG